MLAMPEENQTLPMDPAIIFASSKTYTIEDISANNGASAVDKIRKHWEPTMAFVTLKTEDLTRIALTNPPHTINGIKTFLVQAHRSDTNTIVPRWHGNNADINEKTIAKEFDKLVTEALTAPKRSQMVLPQKMNN